MFGIGFTELLLVLVVALLVVGPDKLPEAARTLAKAYNELRRTGLDLKRSVEKLDITSTLGERVTDENKGAGETKTGRVSEGVDTEEASGDGPGPGERADGREKGMPGEKRTAGVKRPAKKKATAGKKGKEGKGSEEREARGRKRGGAGGGTRTPRAGTRTTKKAGSGDGAGRKTGAAKKTGRGNRAADAGPRKAT